MNTKGEHGTCETVRVKSSDSPDGYVIINESDHDAKKHTLHESSHKPAKAKAAAAPVRKEAKAKGTARVANKKQAKQDAKDAADLDAGESDQV